MNRLIASFALFAAVTIALASPASAQDQPFKANVPFNFTVGNRLFPLGSYKIKPLGTQQIQIENMNHEIFTSNLTYPAYRSRNENNKLVFDKVGAQYFLREVVSTSQGMEFPKSELERKAETLVKLSIDANTKPYSTQ